MNTEIAAVVIPARNESERVVRVVEAVQSADPYLVNVDNIVVVDNGSQDDTAEWAEKAGARVLYEPEVGKGEAIKMAGPIARKLGQGALVMLDADLIGLKGEHVNQLVSPVLSGEAIMNIGYLGCRPFVSKKLLKFWGGFSGQRAISWEVFDALQVADFKSSRLEAALNRIPTNAGRGEEIARLELRGVRHVGQRDKQSSLTKAALAYAHTYGSALRGLLTDSRL